MACCMSRDKQLFEPMMTYCQIELPGTIFSEIYLITNIIVQENAIENVIWKITVTYSGHIVLKVPNVTHQNTLSMYCIPIYSAVPL